MSSYLTNTHVIDFIDRTQNVMLQKKKALIHRWANT